MTLNLPTLKTFLASRIVEDFLSILALKIMIIAFLPMIKPLLNLKSHKLVVLKILYGIGDEMRHYLWTHYRYSGPNDFSIVFMEILH